MNAKTCKMLRHAAGYHVAQYQRRGELEQVTEYHPLAIHHLAEVPTYEQHTRVIRTMTPMGVLHGKQFDQVTTSELTKTRHQTDGKLPFKQIINEKGLPVTTLIPIAKPIRLFAGSVATKDAEAREPTARHVYHTLKRLERMKGLDNVYNEMHDEAITHNPLLEAA